MTAKKPRYWTDVKDISNHYRAMGVDGFYEKHAQDYDNPHKEDIHSLLSEFWEPEWTNIRICDLGCGDGLVTKWMMANHPGCTAVGIDKWMAKRYTEETGFPSFKLDFHQFASDMYPNGTGLEKPGDPKSKFNDNYDLIICSYAFDLIRESMQHHWMYKLSQFTDRVLLIRPNRKVLDTWSFRPIKKVAVGKAKGVLYQFNEDYHEQWKQFKERLQNDC